MYGKIKTLAKEKGIPIYTMEDQLGMARGSICKWDKIKPSYDKVLGVAQMLGASVEELVKE